MAILKIIRKIASYNKLLKESDLPKIEMKFSKKVMNSFIKSNNHKLINLKKDVNKFYIDYFMILENKPRKRLVQHLDLVDRNKIVTQKESAVMGYFLGTGLVLLLICVILCWSYQYRISYDYFKLVFPVFRGILMLILYYWFLAINVFVWNRYNINYKEIFKFKAHYSKMKQILKRASFLTASWFMCACVFSVSQLFTES